MVTQTALRVCAAYKVLVGLEIHVQLATRSKMFTGAANGFGSAPNTQVDQQVLGLPGVLPVMNRKAVEYSILVGLALGCRIASHTKWDRKSYYYPDLPKNYQISQYDLPLCHDGHFDITTEEGQSHSIRIRRAHLEEDAGKLLHEAPGGYAIDHSIVDLNRAGTPLLEIVTEPDFQTPEQVRIFSQELQRLVQHLGVSEGQMQMGHMRFEPNINVHITDADSVVHKTAITEIKNLNSFSVLERATAYEVHRQIQQWIETGSLGRKSTYGWNEAHEATYWQRDKEDAQDYRYFPDPDLMPVEVDESWLAELKARIGELPAQRRSRYLAALESEEAASVLCGDRETGELYDQAVAIGAPPRRVANILVSHGRRLANERNVPLGRLGLSARRLAQLAILVEQGKVAGGEPAGKVLAALLESHGFPGSAELPLGADPPSAGRHVSAEQIAADLGLIQVSDTAPIDAAIDALIAENPKSLQDYRAGKQQARGSLIGMIKKQDKNFNAQLIGERLDAKLKKEH